MIYETPYVLERAAELIEEGWCQGWDAANEHWSPVWWNSKHAKYFCIQGAIFRCEGATRDVEVFSDYIGKNALEFNDAALDKADVVGALLDCAAYLKEKK